MPFGTIGSHRNAIQGPTGNGRVFFCEPV